MQKILIICGPTATGKTALGLKLAQKFFGEIISADSRQVYKGMNVGTGKDIPRNIRYQMSDVRYQGKRIPFFGGNDIKIWGYDLVEPNQEFSVSQFVRTVSLIIKDISRRNMLPVIVGGTGLYINSLLENPETIFVPQNKKLRQNLEKKTVIQLQQELRKVNQEHFNKLNYSDKNNSRRLIRAIEVTHYLHHHRVSKSITTAYDTLWIGLIAPKKMLDNLIEKRVRERAKKNMNQEVQTLTKRYSKWEELPAFSATGYQLWKAYQEKKLTKAQALRKWSTTEKQYARRQLTWFKKNQKIHWFDVTQREYRNQVEAKVKNWYRKVN